MADITYTEILINFPSELYLISLVIALIFVSWYIKNYAILIGSGLFMIIIPFVTNLSDFNIPNSFSYIFFILAGISIIYQGISFLMNERQPKQ